MKCKHCGKNLVKNGSNSDTWLHLDAFGKYHKTYWFCGIKYYSDNRAEPDYFLHYAESLI